jgi:HAD superfamily hydrolase (TIGR01509 family)
LGAMRDDETRDREGPGGGPPRALLFDLDGTLIDTYRLYLEAYQRALEPYLGYRPPVEEIAAHQPSSERRFLAGWIGEENAAACHAAVLRHYGDLHGALCEGIYDGVREMLAAVRAAGYRVGIVTGKGRAAWEITRREIHLGEFDVVVTDDEAGTAKPDPAGLLAAAGALRIEPADAVYLGDSVGDLLAGRNAGMRVAGALWAKTAPGEPEAFREAIAPLAPDWVFPRPADVTRAFARWC